ncbi:MULTISPECIES: alpha/beta hydrolase [Prochlorococcus]|uniref:alpha/beta hydrolase n=1 Tax=Prochlorococcus TaxID=1218 RepID=UPI00053384D1|nr:MULTISPECIES: alpha/beta hydrolase [Prochlorococcus]KGG12130.1 Alpha/beta hydrolase [Prochlorococcus sp. MIT 0601]
MAVEVDGSCQVINDLGIDPFRQRFPWIGGDLQTLRDSFVTDELLSQNGEVLKIKIPPLPNGGDTSGYLMALLNRPSESSEMRGVVLMLHGLGGSSRRRGLRRMALKLLNAGFVILRLNLRGAIPGRDLVAGTYAAKCNSDLIPVIVKAREICDLLWKQNDITTSYIPLFGVGISLGGTILLNACFELINHPFIPQPPLDGLVCISSPLDLVACSAAIEQPRNKFYQKWLLQRLVKQTLADPFGVKPFEREALTDERSISASKITSIRDFDSVITAPRWGFNNVDEYYKNASPLSTLCQNPAGIPETLFIQSLDDPWVPPDAAIELFKKTQKLGCNSKIEVCITSNGGHNGFHGIGGCWGDELVKRWLLKF